MRLFNALRERSYFLPKENYHSSSKKLKLYISFTLLPPYWSMVDIGNAIIKDFSKSDNGDKNECNNENVCLERVTSKGLNIKER